MAMKTMTAISRQKFLWACGLLAACSMIVSTAGAQLVTPRIKAEVTNAEQSTLKNPQHPLAQAQFDAGRMASDTRLEGVSMVFNRSAAQEAGLQALIAAQQNPASPQYHQWLSPEQFAARFGMADADLSKVQVWLEQQGFSVDSIARSKNAIHFTGTVRQVETAFQTEMHLYNINGTKHFAPSTALSLPAALAPTVLGITNLDDFRPQSRALSRQNMRARPNFTQAGSTGASNEFILFAPGDIATAYDIKPLYNSSVTGAGQSISLVGQSAILNSDIEAFEGASGLAIKDPVPFLVPNTGNSTVNPGGPGDESESDLDVEWAGAMAPGATINFVFTGSDLNFGAFDALTYAVDQKIGTIISTSYGLCEVALQGNTLESTLEQATSQGQTVLAAAGDDGSTDCFGISGLTTAQQEALGVDYPASSPNVTGMGGTEISQSNAAYNTVGQGFWESDPGSSDLVNSVQQYIPESVWNDDTQNCGQADCLSAGGGGASSLFTKPTWQAALTPSDGKRDVPDLALYASPNFPGFLFCTSDQSFWSPGQQGSCTNGFEDTTGLNPTFAGGTSFDGPLFSGILALINQKQGYTTGQGLINPTLYALAADPATYAAAFHDITSGNNDCTAGSADCSGSAGFSAGTGYDQVTGLGSVDATVLANAWPAATGTGPTLIATTTTVTASSGTPNVGATDTFTITVAGATGTPTGTVNLTVDGGTAIPETLTSNGTFVYTTSFATAGSHTILAAYVADSTFAASTGSVTVNVATVSSGKGTISFSPAPSPATLTVSQGTSGSETISVTPAGGYTGTVDVNFDTSNDNALQNLCFDFTPNMDSSGDGTIAITGTASGTTTLVLDTNAADCLSGAAIAKTGKHPLRMLHAKNTSKNNGGHPLPLTVAFAGLLLVGFMGRRSRKLRGLAALILLAGVGLAVTACGSSINNTISNPSKGTYTVTVTGVDSAGTIQATPATFTFVVN
jgi:subtilase family serine protease